eukprot:407357-Pleurochrysis_carterae.AAC.2
MGLTGCSSLWDEFRTLTNRLARVLFSSTHLTSISNEFKEHAKLVLGVAASTPARSWLLTTVNPAYFFNGLWLACRDNLGLYAIFRNHKFVAVISCDTRSEE